VKQVLDKISRIETSFKEAYEFANSKTGAGVQDEQGEETFKDLVLKKCPYYFSLLDIMADKASTQPRITNYRPVDPYTDEEPSKAEEAQYDDACGGVGVLSPMGADDDDDDDEDDEDDDAVPGRVSTPPASSSYRASSALLDSSSVYRSTGL
jgi:hypothetical protein